MNSFSLLLFRMFVQRPVSLPQSYLVWPFSIVIMKSFICIVVRPSGQQLFNYHNCTAISPGATGTSRLHRKTAVARRKEDKFHFCSGNCGLLPDVKCMHFPIMCRSVESQLSFLLLDVLCVDKVINLIQFTAWLKRILHDPLGYYSLRTIQIRSHRIECNGEHKTLVTIQRCPKFSNE